MASCHCDNSLLAICFGFFYNSGWEFEMILIKGCDVYAPVFLGKKDVLISGGKIAAVQDRIDFGNILKKEIMNNG